jgi:YMGG-like Gly-zipper
MKKARRIVAVALMTAIVSMGLTTQAQQQRRRAPSMKTRSTAVQQSYLTGVYRLDAASSDDPRVVAERAAGNLPPNEQQRLVDDLTTRLTAPDLLAIERREFTIDIASSRAPRISFEADGRERTEQAADGHEVRTRAVLYGDELMVSSSGSPDDDFSVTFDPIENGRRLRVTRRISSAQLNQPLVIQSIYDKTSDTARWGIFRDQQNTTTTTTTTASNTEPPPPVNNDNSWPQPQFPTVTNDLPSQPSEPTETVSNNALIIPNGTQLVAVLDNDLSTAQSREGDRFRMTVRAPGQYDGAAIEGYISNVRRARRISGRSEMRLNFERITLRDGRTADFTGYIEGVRTVGGEDVRVEPEGGGGVQDRNNQSKRTAQRAAIGAAVGAIIGAIAGGGKGAAIGAAIGAGAGAGSVYAQGREDLELRNGTEVTIRSTATR